MSDKRDNLPVPENDRALIEKADRVTAVSDDVRTGLPESRSSKDRKGFGEQVFFALLGIAVLLFAIALIWSVFFKSGSNSEPLKPSAKIETSVQPTTVTTVTTQFPVGVQEIQNAVTLRVNSIDMRSRYTTLDISVINESHDPVSFLGMADAQLIDDNGNVVRADLSAAGAFITINPNSTVTAKVRFEGPIDPEAKTLTLVVNNVGTIREKWYYEVPFDLNR